MNDKNIILGIETSCDETSVALYIKDKVVDEITTSSANVQANFGGVVPEVATRYHQNNIHRICIELLERNKLNVNDLTHIAYTSCPGLPGCLHIGNCFAQTLSNLTNAQLIPINHLYGHLFSPYINKNEEPHFPLLGLVISGGHTTIYLAHNYKEIEILNQTKDDAVGEVYDKVSRALGMGYPGGPKIDKLYDPNQATITFLKNNFEPHLQFSFSGIKTAVLNCINSLNLKKQPLNVAQIASSFQKTIIDEVIRKLKYYINKHNIKSLSLGGGVAANNYLRNEVMKLSLNYINISELKYTGDQASMIV